MTEKIFSWDSLGDLSIGRPNLGSNVSVEIYRLMQYTLRQVLEEQYGESTSRGLIHAAGKIAGMAYCDRFLDITLGPDAFLAGLHQQLIYHNIGVLRVEKTDMENLHLVLTVSEDLDCSGLPIDGKTVCDYDEGFIAGIMEKYTGKKFIVVEVDCWATGDRTCRFDVTLMK